MTIGSWIVDTLGGVISGSGNTISEGADVDFVNVNGEWIKIKYGELDLVLDEDGSIEIIRDGDYAIHYPIHNPPPGWDILDDLKGNNGSPIDANYDHINDYYIDEDDGQFSNYC